MPALAEAAPDIFLGAVDRALNAGNENPILELFGQNEDPFLGRTWDRHQRLFDDYDHHSVESDDYDARRKKLVDQARSGRSRDSLDVRTASNTWNCAAK